MRLAHGGQANPHGLAWWYVTFEDDVRAPIVGIEISAGDSQTDQWMLTDRGVRCYRYQGSRLTAAGPPLPTVPAPEDLEQTRDWLLRYLPQAVPHRAVPPDAFGGPPRDPPRTRRWEAGALAAPPSMAQVVKLLRTHWPDLLVDPPAHLTPYEVAYEIEAFPHGVGELFAASKALGE